MSVDSLLELLGNRNTIVFIWYIIINFLRSTSSAAAFLAFLWANARPSSIRCKLPLGHHVNVSVPYETIKGKWMPSQCLQYSNFSVSTNRTEPCQLGYVYEGYMDSSIVTEWNLVCDKNILATIADSSFFILSILSSTIFTTLGDRFGRRPVFISCLLSLSAVGFLQTFSPNPYVYIVFRLVLGPLQQGSYALGYCYSLELFPRSRRSIPGLISEIMWVLACCILCLIVYFVKDWRLYYYVTTLPFLSGIALIWLMPESIPWMFARGKTDEAFKTLLGMTRFMKNKEDIIQKLEAERIKQQSFKTEAEEKNEEIYPFYFVITKKSIRKWTMINALVWFALGLSYFAYNVYGTTFGDVYLNFFLHSIIEAPGVLASTYIGVKFGRKLPIIFCFLLAGAIIPFLFLGTTFAPSLIGLNVFFLVTGKFFTSMAFAIIFLHATEMYPTSIRSLGLTIASSATRTGIAISPFVRILESNVYYLPTVMILGFSLIASCLYTLLPETRLWKLPQTLEDVYSYMDDPRYQQPICSCNSVTPEDDLEMTNQ